MQDLKSLYCRESPIQKYKRIISGKDSSWFTFALVEITFSLICWVPGIIGIGLRKLLYRFLFSSFPFSVVIGKQVTIRSPSKICLSKNVFLDEFVQLQAISSRTQAIVLGSNSVINSFSILNSGEPSGYIVIGSNVSIGQATIIYGNGGVDIGDNVLIAGQCFIVASSHSYEKVSIPIADQGITTKGIIIENNVWIGAGVKILDGVTIGSGSIIGASSVVTQSIPKNVIAVGSPCKVIKVRK